MNTELECGVCGLELAAVNDGCNVCASVECPTEDNDAACGICGIETIGPCSMCGPMADDHMIDMNAVPAHHDAPSYAPVSKLYFTNVIARSELAYHGFHCPQYDSGYSLLRADQYAHLMSGSVRVGEMTMQEAVDHFADLLPVQEREAFKSYLISLGWVVS